MIERQPLPEEILAGNDRYEGFCIDLLKELAKEVNFTYRIRVLSEKRYGQQFANGTWDGLIDELIDKVSLF